MFLIGTVRSAQLNYNAEGKSKGIATVVFSKKGDASKAFAEYNNRTLDGRPMKIELIVNPEAAAAAAEKQLHRSGHSLQKSSGGGVGKRTGG